MKKRFNPPSDCAHQVQQRHSSFAPRSFTDAPDQNAPPSQSQQTGEQAQLGARWDLTQQFSQAYPITEPHPSEFLGIPDQPLPATLMMGYR